MPAQNNQKQVPRLSAAVKEAVEGLGFLDMPLEMGLINYSALARRIKPMLEKKLGTTLKVEAITMALHRNIQNHNQLTQKDVYNIVRESKLELEPNAAIIHFSFNKKLEEQLYQIKQNIVFEGGKARIIDRAEELTMITQTRFVDDVIKTAKQKPLYHHEKLALITVEYGAKGSHTPGVLNYFTNLLGQSGVNILALITSYTRSSFLIHESDAFSAYDRFKRSIETAKHYL